MIKLFSTRELKEYRDLGLGLGQAKKELLLESDTKPWHGSTSCRLDESKHIHGSDRSSRPCWWTHGNKSYAMDNIRPKPSSTATWTGLPSMPELAMMIEKHMQPPSDKPHVYNKPLNPKTQNPYRTFCRTNSADMPAI